MITEPPEHPHPAESHAAESHPAPGSAGGLRLWRLLVTLVAGFVLAALVVTSGDNDAEPAPRLGRRLQLVELINAEQARVAAMAAQVEELTAQVADFEQATGAGAELAAALQSQVDAIAPLAGATAVRGPGVHVRLSDSGLDTSPSGNVNDLVIHEQDLQAVINALWAGGAEAASVNSQRVTATTAIRCVGNTLLLHGRVYSPPYEIVAIGDHVALEDALGRDSAVERLRDASVQFGIGFEVASADELEVPAYQGSGTLRVAEPAQAAG
jgi:uncharacterized protein YlxW (UPF0749 family)